MRRLLLVVAFLLPLFCEAGVKLDVNFVPQGSTKPPGDRLDVRVWSIDEEKPIRLSVIALLVTGSNNENITRIKAKSKEFQNTAKEFELVIESKPDQKAEGGFGIADHSLVVPFAELVLPKGKDLKVGYVVIAKDFEDAEFPLASVPTEIVPTTVGDGVRKEMAQPQPQFELVEEKVDAVKLVDGKVVPFAKVSINVKKPLAAAPVTVPVEIKGQYARLSPQIPVTAPVFKGEPKLFKLEPPKIHFATNRSHKSVGDKIVFGSGWEQNVKYGRVTVNVPMGHQVGQIEAVGWWDKQKGFSIANPWLMEGGQEEWLLRFEQTTSIKDTLLFVHGYNNTFEGAMIHAAQVTQDLNFRGVRVAFSWPSIGRTDSYAQDQINAEKSIPQFIEVLQGLLLHHKENGGNMFIIAHSMGNRVVLMGFKDLLAKDESLLKNSPIKLIGLAAPDVDINKFLAWAPIARKVTERMTFYYSTKDWALYGSEKIHTMNRAGLYPAFVDGMDTVNADQTNSSLIGHSYFSASDQLLLDLRLQIYKFQGPKLRIPPLKYDTALSQEFGHDHWLVVPAPISKYKK